MIEKIKPLTLKEAFNLVKDMNDKMHDIEGLSMVPNLTLEVTNTDVKNREFEGRILFLGETLWDAIEDSNDPKEIRETIADEILENVRNHYELMASQIKTLVGKQQW